MPRRSFELFIQIMGEGAPTLTNTREAHEYRRSSRVQEKLTNTAEAPRSEQKPQGASRSPQDRAEAPYSEQKPPQRAEADEYSTPTMPTTYLASAVGEARRGGGRSSRTQKKLTHREEARAHRGSSRIQQKLTHTAEAHAYSRGPHSEQKPPQRAEAPALNRKTGLPTNRVQTMFRSERAL